MAKGRKSRNVEFFQLLAELLDLNTTQLAKRTGRKASNVHNYRSGKSIPGNKLLLSALKHAFEWEVKAIFELRPIAETANELPNQPGVYCLYDSAGNLVYVGQATDLKLEVAQALQRKMNFAIRLSPKLSKKVKRKYKAIASHLSAYEVHSQRMRHNLEAFLLRTFPNQSHNNKMGNFK